MRKGSLTVVGVGYKIAVQTTLEAHYSITTADRLFYLVNDKLTEQWLRSLNSKSTSLADCYVEGRPGMDCGNEMVDRMMAAILEGRSFTEAVSTGYHQDVHALWEKFAASIGPAN